MLKNKTKKNLHRPALSKNEKNEKISKKKANPIFKKFKKILESDYTEDRTVVYYADLINIHPYCLNKISKISSGQTASEVIQNKIISEAKALILNTDKTLKDIAYKLGFDDPAYFSRYFKKHTGIAPSNFQKQRIGTHL